MKLTGIQRVLSDLSDCPSRDSYRPADHIGQRMLSPGFKTTYNATSSHAQTARRYRSLSIYTRFPHGHPGDLRRPGLQSPNSPCQCNPRSASRLIGTEVETEGLGNRSTAAASAPHGLETTMLPLVSVPLRRTRFVSRLREEGLADSSVDPVDHALLQRSPASL
ncbi:hypothetical protein PENANT_c040G10499 [Penicillium antarcticum]|uniref:Uncharacterized protein n=1 Tax=Penicillium antarcticum TaxID=416450 RepID=A0A1V6PSR2_9EURO|nr:uncharacterized protein N7508_000243 [Penicillium antarcticum]KAJ5319960.1 hypothetical protein N7508_000243 [Penicillium antarcticum]OQD80035.1 hypothetical protein PENANT_c040G10499 [Penicillium antarcticum]